jgi:hypothetical protein
MRASRGPRPGPRPRRGARPARGGGHTAGGAGLPGAAASGHSRGEGRGRGRLGGRYASLHGLSSLPAGSPVPGGGQARSWPAPQGRAARALLGSLPPQLLHSPTPAPACCLSTPPAGRLCVAHVGKGGVQLAAARRRRRKALPGGDVRERRTGGGRGRCSVGTARRRGRRLVPGASAGVRPAGLGAGAVRAARAGQRRWQWRGRGATLCCTLLCFYALFAPSPLLLLLLHEAGNLFLLVCASLWCACP